MMDGLGFYTVLCCVVQVSSLGSKCVLDDDILILSVSSNFYGPPQQYTFCEIKWKDNEKVH
jgi:hypothetical protein